MKTKILGLLAVGLLAGPTAANATTVSWLFQGQLTNVGGSDAAALGFSVGQSFSAILHFETCTAANNNAFNQANCFPAAGGPGSTCRHNGASPAAQFWSDVTINGVNCGVFPPPGPASEFSKSIIVRNDASDPEYGDPVDGHSFGTERCELGSVAGIDQDAYVNVIMRGLDLSLVTDALLLPENPSALMSSLRTHQWNLCSGLATEGLSDCQYVVLNGDFTSVSRVPEPATLALLGLGLASLGMSRRRKTL